MKLGPVTKRDTKQRQKKRRHGHFSNLWPIAAIRKPDSRRIVCKTFILQT